MSLEISQIQTLVAVAKTGSFSKAAEELHVTQSAISQSIKNLEQKIEVPLFSRSGKKVSLTLEGEKLYLMSKKFLARIDETLNEIRQDKNEMSGKIRIGTLMGIGKSWLGDQLMDFVEEYPLIHLNIHLSGPSQLVKDFERFYLDCIITPEGYVPHVGEKIHYCDEFITLVFPKDGKGVPPEVFETFQKGECPKDISDLVKVPLIAFEHDDPLFLHWCKSVYDQRPQHVNRRLVVNSHGKMLQAVSKGLGMAILPTHVLKRSYYRDQVATLSLNFEVFHNRFYLVYHKESKELKRMNIFREKLLSLNLPENRNLQ
jgi:DNA-binding transcriptional LysR family regulator